MSNLDRPAPKMPAEYIGKVQKSGGHVNSEPRRWTKKEVEWIEELRRDGYSAKEIAESVGRTQTSVAVKLKRLGKNDGTYNSDHAQKKRALNLEFIEHIGARSVLDCYSGDGSQYAHMDATTNDKDEKTPAQYHMDGLRFCCLMYAQGNKFDFVDLDPYGSAFDCLDLAIKMARKGIAVTFGEMGHRRFKRMDYVRHRYGINSLDCFTLDALISRVAEIGAANKKRLTVWRAEEWHNIARVWFEIEPSKTTEQWEERHLCPFCGSQLGKENQARASRAVGIFEQLQAEVSELQAEIDSIEAGDVGA